MSLPNIPQMPGIPCIPVNASLSLVLVSIAMEEIGLSHIINAEGEKIQSITCAMHNGKANICDLIKVNESVSDTLRNVLKKEILLEMKMVEVLEALETCDPCKVPCREG